VARRADDVRVTTARLNLAAAVLAAGLLLAPPAAANRVVAPHAGHARSLEASLLVAINAVRADHGLRPLRANARLAAAAGAHTRAMVERGFFAHESRDGTPFWRRIRRFYAAAGYGYWSVGENLLWSSPDVDASEAVRMWMQSPPHRKNLLTSRWRELGLAAVHSSAAPGSFGGRPVTVLTADFGVRG
jgi:uncharacterized protein YkwD